MVLTGCLRNVEDAYKTINWESIVLIAAMLPMSLALEKTGASAMISSGLVSYLGDFGPIILLAGIYFTINGFDEVDNSVSITTFNLNHNYICEEREKFSSEKERNEWLKSLEILPKGTEIKITF